jgi:hypothetical protein
LPSALSGRHPAKNFFFNLCRVPWPWHSAKLGIHTAKPLKLFFLFFYSIITNTAYKRYISHLKHHKHNIAHIYHIHLITNSISHRQHIISHTRHHKHNRSNYHRNKPIVDHSA